MEEQLDVGMAGMKEVYLVVWSVDRTDVKRASKLVYLTMAQTMVERMAEKRVGQRDL